LLDGGSGDPDPGAITIAVLVGRPDLYLSRPIDMANPGKSIPDESAFFLKLRRVVDVLKLTSTAVAKVTAPGFAPRRGRSDNSIYGRAGEVALALDNVNIEKIAGRRKRHKDREPFGPSYTVASISNSIDRKPNGVSY
jgi:hypothetical protein